MFFLFFSFCTFTFSLSLICTLSTIAWNFAHCLQEIAEHLIKIKINGMQNAQKETEKREPNGCQWNEIVLRACALNTSFNTFSCVYFLLVPMHSSSQWQWQWTWMLVHYLKIAHFKMVVCTVQILLLALSVQTSLFMEMLMANSILILYEFILSCICGNW